MLSATLVSPLATTPKKASLCPPQGVERGRGALRGWGSLAQAREVEPPLRSLHCGAIDIVAKTHALTVVRRHEAPINMLLHQLMTDIDAIAP